MAAVAALEGGARAHASLDKAVQQAVQQQAVQQQAVQQAAGQDEAELRAAASELSYLLCMMAQQGQQQHVTALLQQHGLVQAVCMQLQRLLHDAAVPAGRAAAAAAAAAGPQEAAGWAQRTAGEKRSGGGSSGSSSAAAAAAVGPLVTVLHSLRHWSSEQLLRHGAVPLMEDVMGRAVQVGRMGWDILSSRVKSCHGCDDACWVLNAAVQCTLLDAMRSPWWHAY
jgi:hypothetical protein